MKYKKIALFGGSFNPIQNSHIKLIKYLINKKIVNEVWIIPCKNHPFSKELLKSKERIKMIKIALNSLNLNKKVRISDVEIKSRGKNYTLKTIRALKKLNKNKEFYFIIGSDILKDLKKWYKYRDLLKEIEFILFIRKGYGVFNFPGIRFKKIINFHPDNLSSTEIRKRICDGKPLTGFVPPDVEVYIIKNKLYKSPLLFRKEEARFLREKRKERKNG